MNATVAQVTDPNTNWMVEDTFIHETLIREANRTPTGGQP